MKQYPHFLFSFTPGESIQDAEGNWSQSNSFLTYQCICREETNGKGSIINNQDGNAIVFSSVIYLPLSAPPLIDGTEIVVIETKDELGVVRVKKPILKYYKGQLNTRIWV